jgi:hypothetical protein
MGRAPRKLRPDCVLGTDAPFMPNPAAVFFIAILAPTVYASDEPPASTEPNPPRILAERTADGFKYKLRVQTVFLDRGENKTSDKTGVRLELQETRANGSSAVVRWSAIIHRSYTLIRPDDPEASPAAAIGVSQDKLCVVLANRLGLSVFLADRSGTIDLDERIEKLLSTEHVPKYDGTDHNHPTMRQTRRWLHTTTFRWPEMPGVTAEEANAALKAGTLQPISVESNANAWFIRFQISQKKLLGRYSEDKSGAVTWDARREP